MENNLMIKKCLKCGALVEVLKDCKCISCCGEEMKTLNPITNEVEVKHLPILELESDKLKVIFKHVMEEEHLIKYVWMINGDKICKHTLKPNSDGITTFKYIKGSTIYSYCNKHGLWKKEVE